MEDFIQKSELFSLEFNKANLIFEDKIKDAKKF